ncbi:MAG: CoA pyrophosphatase [bacterium]|nr:CoA pyrophosphatase [bacterium]
MPTPSLSPDGGASHPQIRHLLAALGEEEVAAAVAERHESATIPDTFLESRARRQPVARPRQAAVLILLSDTDSPDLTFVERAATLRHHPGQIAFPGGGIDPGESAVQAALREAHEEIRLEPHHVRPHRVVPASNVAASMFDVAAVVGTWDGTAPIGVGDPGEVAAIHRFAITDLADPDNRLLATLPGGYQGPAFTMGEIFLWGFTANLVSHVLDLGGWSRPWSRSRLAEVPERFLRDARRGSGPARTWADSAE